MAARKKFVVIAYDISNTRRRNRVVKAVQQYGGRVNLSVFECMVTDSQFKELVNNIEKTINTKEDKIIFYTICTECYTKIIYTPDKRHKAESSTMCI